MRIASIIFAIIFSISIGFVMGVKYRTEKHVCHVERIKIAGYTKIAYGKGIDQNGDTVKVLEYADLNIKHYGKYKR